MGGFDRLQYLPVRGEGFLQRGGNVLDQHRRRAHVYQQQRQGAGNLRRAEPLPLQQVQHSAGGRGVPHGVAAVPAHGVGENLCQQKLAHVVVATWGMNGVQSRQQPYKAGSVTADIVGQAGITQCLVQSGGVDRSHGEKTQYPGPWANIPQDAHAVPGIRRDHLSLVGSYCCLQFLPQLPVRLPIELKIQISRPDQLLVLRFPQVQAVAVDEVLYCRIDQVGDVPAQVDVFPDAGRADILQVSGELQLDDLAADAAQVRVDLVAFGIAGAAEDDVVQRVNGARCGGCFVGRGIGDYVGSHRQIGPPAAADPLQSFQIGGGGQVHGNVVGEEIHIELVGHGHADDLPPDQGGLGLLGPGELIDRQVHLKPQIPDFLDDTFVAQREGVESAWEESGFLRHMELEGATFNTVGNNEAVDVT